MGLSSIIIAFVYSWQLTLVVLAFVPFIAFAGAVQTKLNTSFAKDEQEHMGESGAVSTLVLNNTVFSKHSVAQFFLLSI